MILLQRDGDRDLQFEGEVVGAGSWTGNEDSHRVMVTIYRVTTNEPVSNEPRYVVSSELSYRQTDPKSDEFTDEFDVRHNAKVCVGSKAVLEALLHQGRLGKASKEAWEAACDKDPDLSPERYERL